MRVLRYPIACEQCFSALKGTVEIKLLREGDNHYLDVQQTVKLDWSICSRCQRIVCLASCWNIEKGFCKSCAPFSSMATAAVATAVAAVVAKQTDACPECQKTLTGAIEVVETEMQGVPVISLEETSDRNWIQCDSCNTVVCKSCCLNPRIGFCNRCLSRIESAGSSQARNQPQNEQQNERQNQPPSCSQKQTTEVLGGQIK